MSKPGGILKWSKYFILLFLAVCIGYVAHELAHFGMYKALGYSPLINWKSGSVSAYDTAGEIIPRVYCHPKTEFYILAGRSLRYFWLLGSQFTQTPVHFCCLQWQL
jgi:hypothetical protein